jgi:hypothetical protein
MNHFSLSNLTRRTLYGTLIFPALSFQAHSNVKAQVFNTRVQHVFTCTHLDVNTERGILRAAL